MEIVLKRFLHPVPAHQRVHQIALIPVADDAVFLVALPVLLIDGGEAAENVRGIGGVINTGRGGAGFDALVVSVHHLSDQLHRNIGGEDIVAAQQMMHRQLIADAGDQTRLGIGIGIVNAIELTQ